jgi:putative tricarboxylic transport membrane protein
MTFKIFSEKTIGGLIAFVIGFLSLIEGIRLYPYSESLLTGDHAFPGFIGILLILFGFSSFFERKKDEDDPDLPSGKTRLVLISSIAILFIYCFLIMMIGYVVSTLIVSICLIKVIGHYRWLFACIFGSVLTTILYFLFIHLLKIPFPVGYFPF